MEGCGMMVSSSESTLVAISSNRSSVTLVRTSWIICFISAGVRRGSEERIGEDGSEVSVGDEDLDGGGVEVLMGDGVRDLIGKVAGDCCGGEEVVDFCSEGEGDK